MRSVGMRRAVVVVAAAVLLAAACGEPSAAPTPVQPATSAPPASDQVTDFESRPADADEPAPLEPSEPFDLAVVTLNGPDGTAIRMPVYVAATPRARGRGLMFREELHPRAGMVFLFPGEVDGGFFMKNTLIPLSILFYGPDGDVRAVLDMEPCTAEPCEVYNPGVAYVGAIEVNQGYFDEIGLNGDWTVMLPGDLPAPR